MQASLGPFLLASVLFYASHIVLSAAGVRRLLVARIGEKGFTILYSLLSLALFIAMIWTFVEAPDIMVYAPPAALRWVPMVVMVPAVVFLVCGYSQSNPTAIGQGPDRAITGAIRITRHPLMWAVGLWAGSHLLVAADLAGLVLFAPLLAFAVYGMVRFDAKKRALWGPAWSRFAGATSIIPFVAILQGRNRLALGEIGPVRLALAAVLYVAIVMAHGYFGHPI